MIRVGWDSNGYPRWTMIGDETIMDDDFSVIDDGIDPQSLWRSPDGEIIVREPLEMTVDRTIIHSNGVDEAIITDLPLDCELIINSEIYRDIEGEFAIKSHTETVVMVKIGGPYRGEVMILVQSSEKIMEAIRLERDRLLTQCDWTQVADADLTVEKKAEWSAYRKVLRDLPADQPEATIETVVWPVMPTK